jgi:hypothetical protein
MAKFAKELQVETSEKIAEAFRNTEIITEAITRATKLALRQHKLAGNSIAIGQNGKVVLVPASEIHLEDSQQ